MGKVNWRRGVSRTRRKYINQVSKLTLTDMRLIERATEAMEQKLGVAQDLESRTHDSYINESTGYLSRKKRRLSYDEKKSAKQEMKQGSQSFKKGMDRLTGGNG